MTPERWRRIEEVFAAVWNTPTDARTAMARKLAGDDVSLASEVLSLVNAADASPDYFERLAARLPLGDSGPEQDGVTQEQDKTGHLVGPYRLIRLLGHGGMGSVYLAERADGAFDQTVAIKLLPSGRMRPTLERRFLAERQILARLEHPHIARLIDGGVMAEQTPYFVMEYVDGLPIDEYCERHALSIDRRLRLLLDVCAAVDAAHRNLVVHRDLKPTNVLVTADGTVKLLDFGIAKLLTDDDGTTEPQPLTPAYASPEQLEGRPLTTTVDVWGLGVILYELLAGRRPFEGGSAGERRLAPPPASQFRRGLSRELDTIVLTALHAQPERRYSSVALLASDVRRYLEGLPIAARTESWTYRVTCFARRHPYGVAAAGLIVSLLCALTALIQPLPKRCTSWGWPDGVPDSRTRPRRSCGRRSICGRRFTARPMRRRWRHARRWGGSWLTPGVRMTRFASFDSPSSTVDNLVQRGRRCWRTASTISPWRFIIRGRCASPTKPSARLPRSIGDCR